MPDDISKVSLFLYVTNQHVYKVDIKHCYALERDWQENSVTWNSPWQSPGGAFSEPPVFINTNTTKNVWEEFDVTDEVKAIINNSKPNYGFIVTFPSTNDKSRAAYYRSSEYTGDKSLRPKLTIVTGATGMADMKEKGDTRVEFRKTERKLWIYIPNSQSNEVCIYTIAGKKLTSFKVDSGSKWYHIADSFSPGTHIISIKGNGRTVTKKVHFVK